MLRDALPELDEIDAITKGWNNPKYNTTNVRKS